MNVFDRTYLRVKNTLWAWFTDEEGDVNVVSIVVLIGIAVALALVFRKQAAGVIEHLFEAIQGNADKVIDPNNAPK